MIPIRTKKYELTKGYEDLLNRIKLQVERSEDLHNTIYSNYPDETTRAWVGKVDSVRGTFEITRTNPSAILPLRFIDGNFFTLIVEGRITGDQHKTHINVNYTLGVQASIMMLLLTMLPVIMLPQIISHPDFQKESNSLIFFGLTFILIPILILIAQLNHTENMILDFLGIKTTPT